MNSVRIAMAGYIVNNYGLEWVDGFSHFFEGWVIFIACVLILFLLARIMMLFNTEKMTLVEALDLDTDGLWTQFLRLRLVRPSAALIFSGLIMVAGVVAWETLPPRNTSSIEREGFMFFPRQLGEWEQQGSRKILDEQVAKVLGADDYHSIDLMKLGENAPVSLFMAWYADQSQGGVHSPEICLPGGGWEIAWLERTDITETMGSETPFNINRAIIQKGTTRMMVYYWFEQKNRRIAWDFAAKFWLLVDGITTGRTDGALVRLVTAIQPGETDAEAEARLRDVLNEIQDPLPRYIPGS